MNQDTFNSIVGIIFLVGALAHLARVVFGWEATVNGWLVPSWASVIAIVVSGALSWAAFSEKQ